MSDEPHGDDPGPSPAEATIERYFASMRRGPAAEADLLALFARDAVYEEPFSGVGSPAVGIDEIRARLRLGWTTPLPDLELDVLGIDIDGDEAVARWECRSTGLAGPVRGEDRYRMDGGRIVHLMVRITDRPNPS